jgi:hypothetical protein
MIPKGYNHKATSEGFNGNGKAVIYYSNENDKYFIMMDDQPMAFLTKSQLELLIHAATDVIDMTKR